MKQIASLSPFAHGDSGAQTSVKQSLTYSSYAYESLSLGPAAPRADLAFAHGAPETPLAARQVGRLALARGGGLKYSFQHAVIDIYIY